MNHIFEDESVEKLAQARGFSRDLDRETLDLDRIRPHPDHIRGDIDQAELEDLANTMLDVGVLCPIQVIYCNPEGCYYCVAGERRLRAAQLAGLKRIPVQKLPDGTSPEAMQQIRLVENLQRSDLRPMELAIALKGLVDKGMTQVAVAEMIGKSQAFVSKALCVAAVFAGANPTLAGESHCMDVLHEAATSPPEARPAILAAQNRAEARQTAKGKKPQKGSGKRVLRKGKGFPDGTPAEPAINRGTAPVRRPFTREFQINPTTIVAISCTDKPYLPPEEIAIALQMAVEQLNSTSEAA